MGDYLKQVAARALGKTNVRPRMPSLFEPPVAALGTRFSPAVERHVTDTDPVQAPAAPPHVTPVEGPVVNHEIKTDPPRPLPQVSAPTPAKPAEQVSAQRTIAPAAERQTERIHEREVTRVEAAPLPKHPANEIRTEIHRERVVEKPHTQTERAP